MAGYIKLHRQLLENPIVCKDGDHIAVWVYLLLSATHKECAGIHNGKKIMLQPGQLTDGRRHMSERLGISESKIQRVLKCFESEQQIEQLTCAKNRLITVKNWSKYQGCEQPNEQQMNSYRTASEQLVNTIQECKEIKNDKKDIYTVKFASFWAVYPRKVSKQKAEQAFMKLKPDDDLYSKIMDGLEKSKRSAQWTKDGGQFIPHAATWLNGRRWEDEDDSQPNKWDNIDNLI